MVTSVAKVFRVLVPVVVFILVAGCFTENGSNIPYPSCPPEILISPTPTIPPTPSGAPFTETIKASVPTTLSGDSAPKKTSLQDLKIFPDDHIWNVPINTMPVDSRSVSYINNIGRSSYLGMYRGIPYNVVNDSVIHQKVSLLRSWSDFIQYPVPENPLIEPGGNDKHMIIVDQDEGMLYEFYKASRSADGTWHAQSGFSYNLSGYALRPKGYTTADAAGLPIFPGLVRYDEVRLGSDQPCTPGYRPRNQPLICLAGPCEWERGEH